MNLMLNLTDTFETMKNYKVQTDTISEIFSDRNIAEKELQNLIANGKQARLIETVELSPAFIHQANEAAAKADFNKPEFMAGSHPLTFRSFYTYGDEAGNPIKNAKGETIVVEVGMTEDSGKDNGLHFFWYKRHLIDRILPTCWHITTYVTNSAGDCYGYYNPQSKKDGNRMVVDFDWMFEAEPDNLYKLLSECAKRFNQQ